MISPELAHQLKNAGFPQNAGSYVTKTDRHGAWESAEGIEEFDIKIGGRERWAYIPTLAELIEACDEPFFSLERTRPDHEGEPQWLAVAIADHKPWPHGSGQSAEEAVARLWLILNQNNI